MGALAVVVLAMLAAMTAMIVWWHTRAATGEAGPTVVVSGDTAGWITSGCTLKQPGGLARRASYLNDLREQGSVIYLDAGGAAGGTSEYHRIKFEAMIEGERTMQIAAHNLGKSELALGPDYLRQIGSRTHFPFVSDNTRDLDGRRIIENRRVIESSGMHVGIIGVVSPLYRSPQVIVDDPRQAVADAVAALKGHCRFLIVLAYMPEDEQRKLAADVSGVDAIVGGAGEEIISPKAAGATTLAAAGEYGKQLVEMRVPLSRALGAWEGKMVEMSSTIADDATQINNIQRYLNALEAKDFSSAESGVAGTMPAADQAMAGSSSCLKCHSGDYNAWIGSRHARAFASLAESGFHVDSSCQKCHTSNFGMAGGFVSARRSGASELAGVGCESCHGPSAAHVKDPKGQHTTWPAIVQCVRCHTEESCPHFDYLNGWGKIRHGKKG